MKSISSKSVKVLLFLTLFINASSHQLHSESDAYVSYAAQAKVFEALIAKSSKSRADENLKQAEEDTDPSP